MNLFDLNSYQTYLLYAYMVGVITQIIVLYGFSCYFDNLTFLMYFALVYIVLAGLHFVYFMKVIKEKKQEKQSEIDQN